MERILHSLRSGTRFLWRHIEAVAILLTWIVVFVVWGLPFFRGIAAGVAEELTEKAAYRRQQ